LPHLAQKQPFLNLSDLFQDELSVVMRDLEDRCAKEELKRGVRSTFSVDEGATSGGQWVATV
jgi:hypothetical protein